MDINTLYQLPENDLKLKLNKNKFFNKGALVLCNNDIFEILFRFNNNIVARNIKDNTQSINNIENVELLTLEKFKELKLKNIGDVVSKDIKNTITYLNSVLKRTFGDNYDIVLTSNNIEIIVLFHQIEVKNSLDIRHTMSDVYLKIILYYSNVNNKILFSLNNFSLYRGKYFKEELNIQYMFSHISGVSGSEKFQDSWCLGNTEFKKYVNNLKYGVNILDIVFIILQFKAYLSWESIEGTPYKYLVNLKPFDKLNIELNSKNVDFNKIYKRVLKRLGKFKYSIGLDNNNYTITLDESSVDKIKEIASTLYPEYCYYLIDGKSVEIEELDVDINRFSFSEYYFKGNKIIPEIIPNKKTLESLETIKTQFKKSIHVTISDFIVSKIQVNFIDYFLKNKLK